MIRCALVVLCLGFGASAATAAPDDDKKDSERLQGSWKMASLNVNGEKVPDDAIEMAKLVVKDDQYTITLGEQTTSAAKFTMDSSKTPKQVDFKYTEGLQKGQTAKGIYKLDGDTFTMCRSLTEEGDRPAEFTAAADSGRLLVVWTRQAK
jgi:uncharacterized protein (TIGR03067 family)